MTLLLTHQDVDGLLSMDEAIEAARQGFVEQGQGLVQVPHRITIDSSSGHGWLRVMPGILNGSGFMGFKAMNSTPKVGVRYLVMLYDLQSGALVAQIDADWITQVRTSAVAAVATDLLARQDAVRAGVLGSGEQATALLTAVSRVRRLSEVRVFSPTPTNRQRFAETMSQGLGAKVMAVDSAVAALEGADLVLSAVRSGKEPTLKAAWVPAGAHLNAISSVRPDSRELEDEVWRMSAAVVVDDRAHAFESGDGRSVLGQNLLRQEDAAELWELVNGSRPGRQRPEDVTLFKSAGTAAQDLVLATAIYKRALERGLGKEIGEFPHIRGF